MERETDIDIILRKAHQHARCARCNKGVEFIALFEDEPMRRVVRFEVQCHGETESFELTEDQIWSLRKRGWQMTDTNFFTQRKLTQETA